MRRRRLVVAALVALALAPGTFVRTHIPIGTDVDVTFTRVTDLPEMRESGGFTREGVWELHSQNINFGGYSALLMLDSGLLRAFSDRGSRLTFSAPGQRAVRETRFAFVWNRGTLRHTQPDIEAATRDPATGDYWLAFEQNHAIIRYSLASDFEAARQPPEWQNWDANGGVEAMARLPDGRLLVLPERDATGLLYGGDPTADIAPLQFQYSVPDGYSPTDLTVLPDGRVLVLLRQVTWAVPPFSCAIAIADPRRLEEGGTLDLELLARLETILPRDNYEALAFAGVQSDGTVQLWLMTDDNLASFQRTLLAKLIWREPDAAHEKAREEP